MAALTLDLMNLSTYTPADNMAPQIFTDWKRKKDFWALHKIQAFCSKF